MIECRPAKRGGWRLYVDGLPVGHVHHCRWRAHLHMVELTRARYSIPITHEDWGWDPGREAFEAYHEERLAHDELRYPAPPIDRKEPHALDPG